jgi:hypothetical protein
MIAQMVCKLSSGPFGSGLGQRILTWLQLDWVKKKNNNNNDPVQTQPDPLTPLQQPHLIFKDNRQKALTNAVFR